MEAICDEADQSNVAPKYSARLRALALELRTERLQELSIIESADPDDLLQIADEAVAAGCSSPLVEAVRRNAEHIRLAQSKNTEQLEKEMNLAQEKLQEAKHALDPAEMEQACDQVEAKGRGAHWSCADLVAEVRQSARWMRAVTELQIAEVAGNVPRIEQACNEAEDAMVDACLVLSMREKAKQIHSLVEEMLSNAQAASDPGLIEEACRAAETAGVHLEKIPQLQNLLTKLRIQEALQDADCIVNLGDLQHACVEAEKMGLDPNMISKAYQRIALLKARQRLLDAESQNNVAAIYKACFEARMAGEDESVLLARQRRAQQLNAESQLRAMSNSAGHAQDFRRLDAACYKARAAGLSEERLNMVLTTIEHL
eukprot:gnl/MRDRNA2_/MRDRNA2_72585_c0_seq1.p1 gnl/MRDRNA2_/MRDRNA2_72585_c0~~gnl/MRDRNA2_/MRDRNA2_72585_c0_seq1.p1  ORF type:complete len:372 (+),score=102.78 gnl/MRDRNA2_/MRDRNA2_72585_c0_seq1:80-1195(+)